MTLTKDAASGHSGRMTLTRMVAVLLAMPMAGCVTVNAPERPIVINLNISVTQEVVYRLDNDARSLIQAQPGIF